MIDRNQINIREIKIKDNKEIADVIREVMPEFGADGPGFAITDPEVDKMFEAYDSEGCIYYIAERDGKVYGGAGIAPLNGHGSENQKICELQKMYFKKEIRGLGIGQKLMDLCLDFARSYGYEGCYIETLTGMDHAKKLYLKNDFEKINAPLGNTGHFSCDSFYFLKF